MQQYTNFALLPVEGISGPVGAPVNRAKQEIQIQHPPKLQPFGRSGPTVHQAVNQTNINQTPMFQPLNGYVPVNRLEGKID